MSSVEVTGASEVDPSDLKEAIATTASPKFLGLFRGVVYDYSLFDRYTLQRDLARIERYYRARGYYDVKVRAGRVMHEGDDHVRVEIVVEEGLPVLNAELRIDGLEHLPKEVSDAVWKAARNKLKKGRPFDEDDFQKAEEDLKRALTDRGYAWAKVKRDAYVDVVKHLANVVFVIDAGELAVFGKVTLVGLDPDGPGPREPELPEEPIRRTIDIHEGDPYSTSVMLLATQALLDLGVFTSVEIDPELPDPPPPDHVVPLTVRLEPGRLRRVRLGAGVELDQIKTDVHLLFGWEHQNFLGGLRSFRIDFRPGVVLYPTRINDLEAPKRLLPEERLRLQLKQPGVIEARTNGVLRTEANVFPLLVKTNPGAADPVIGYRELRGTLGLDRTYWKLFGSVSHNVQVEDPFAYKGGLDPSLRTLILSYPEIIAQLDLRDDRVRPHAGFYLGGNLQLAGFGGHARDVKVQPELRTYVPLGRRLTFATRGSVGFLYPQNYGDVVQNHLGDPLTPENRAARVRDIETVLFRGFFSGGPTSNRGFPVRGVSPHGVVPFLNPSTASQQIALRCDPSPENDFKPDPSLCSIPIGGFTLWELSNELRFFLSQTLSVVTFCDMSDVSPHTVDIRVRHLHLACGLGGRYMTPVGPIRLDIGYRIQPLQVLGHANEDDVVRADPTEGVQPRLLGIPLAFSFGIGEAY